MANLKNWQKFGKQNFSKKKMANKKNWQKKLAAKKQPFFWKSKKMAKKLLTNFANFPTSIDTSHFTMRNSFFSDLGLGFPLFFQKFWRNIREI